MAYLFDDVFTGKQRMTRLMPLVQGLLIEKLAQYGFGHPGEIAGSKKHMCIVLNVFFAFFWFFFWFRLTFFTPVFSLLFGRGGELTVVWFGFGCVFVDDM